MPDLDLNVKVKVDGAPAVGRLGQDFDRAGDSVGRLGKVGTGVFQGIGQAVAGFGLGLASAGIGAVMDTIGTSIGLASDKAEALSKVQVLFGDSSRIVEEASKGAATAVGLSSGAYLDAAGTLGNLLVNFGFAGDQAAGMSTDMIALAADMGSFNNADPSEVVAAMGAAFRGESEPIRRFGVMLDDATVKAKAVELGLYSGVGALDKNAKAQATYQLILAQTSNAQGDFQRTASGLANSQRISAAKQEEAWTKLGGAIMPLANMIVPLLADAVTGLVDVIMLAVGWVQDFVHRNQGLFDALSKVAGIIMGVVSKAFDLILGLIGRLVDWWSTLTTAFLSVAGIFADVGSRIFDGLVGAITNVVGFFGGLWDTIASIGGKIMDVLGGLFRPLGDSINGAIDVVKGAWNAFARFWNSIGIDIPRITIPNPFGGDFVVGGGRFSLPNLPILDRGGIITGPTIAALAQNNRPEAVIPLDRLGGSVTINVYAGVGDPVAIGRQIVQAIREYERANGPAF